MGMLLSFSPIKPAKSRPKPSSGTSASIIIFPGIRYERQNVLDRIGQIIAKSELPKPGLCSTDG
jgi:hypothetical protein